MPGENKYPLLGAHVYTELADWARSEAKRRGITLTALITEALEKLRRGDTEVVTASRPRTAAPAAAQTVQPYSKKKQLGGKQ